MDSLYRNITGQFRFDRPAVESRGTALAPAVVGARLMRVPTTTERGRRAATGVKPKTDAMNWSRRKYKIQFENGDQGTVTGISNGLFGLSAGGVLTHLATGYRVARFPDQAAGRAAGDYLAAAYAEEFDALHRAFSKSLTYAQFRSLPEVMDLNAKIQDDDHFNRLITAAELERRRNKM